MKYAIIAFLARSSPKLRQLVPVSEAFLLGLPVKTECVRRVTSVRFGIQTVSPQFFDGVGPDFVVAGPNVGANLGKTTLESGTV